jgi:hypothetical protein
MYTLHVTVTDPLTAQSDGLTRSFDPTLPPATLQAAWSNLGAAVLTLIQSVQGKAATVAPTPL